MHLSVLLITLPLLVLSLPQSAPLNAPSSQVIGNYYNYWTLLNTTPPVYDLTRSSVLPVTSPKTLSNVFTGSRKSAIIEPSRSALVIIDMQNFFLDPELSPGATGGRGAVPPTLRMIDGFRAMGSKVLWTNWGLTEQDLVEMPASFKEGFASEEGDVEGSTFGSDMGSIKAGNGSEVQVGRKLMRGSWNAQPWGDLYPAMVEGLASGTDLYFNKNRLSGLWGAQTPLGIWLEENQITTLFFGGVNADQCVWGTFLDAYYKGYDVVYVDDISQTVSPFSARQMVRYNANLDGFVGNSTEILAALAA
ncbi:T-complex protein 1 subunit gamma [Sphaceloma murrayae]|uniref:T-complex protein 1 subunit gamma n=1 Tax=Sphaceloma murrayae TaxID=2082308 RepID=A0A2K1QTP1_9PEZI|nr:T-complex protein 1 subunit gamma [Sphaceloma murrayae]